LRPVPAATGGLLLEDSLAAGLAQGFYLGGGVLVVGLGDAGVADEHRALPHRLSDSLPLKPQRARQTNVMAARGPVEIPPEATPEPLLRQRR